MCFLLFKPPALFRMLSFSLQSVKRHKIPMILFFTLQMAVQNPLGVWVEIAFIIAFWLNSDFMVPWHLCLFSSLLWKSNWSCMIKVYINYILPYKTLRSRVFSFILKCALPGSSQSYTVKQAEAQFCEGQFVLLREPSAFLCLTQESICHHTKQPEPHRASLKGAGRTVPRMEEFQVQGQSVLLQTRCSAGIHCKIMRKKKNWYICLYYKKNQLKNT